MGIKRLIIIFLIIIGLYFSWIVYKTSVIKKLSTNISIPKVECISECRKNQYDSTCDINCNSEDLVRNECISKCNSSKSSNDCVTFCVPLNELLE